MRNRRHNDPRTSKPARNICVVVENARRAWAISAVLEGVQELIELRRMKRRPDGSLRPTEHRSTIKAEMFRAIAAAFLEDEARVPRAARTEGRLDEAL